MTLPAIAALIERILGVVATILGVVLDLNNNAAREHQPYAIETIASNATNTVNNPFFGNAALLTAIQEARDAIIDRIDQFTVPVTGDAVNVSQGSVQAISEGYLAAALTDYTAQTLTVGQALAAVTAMTFNLSRNMSVPLPTLPMFELSSFLGFHQPTDWIDQIDLPEPDWSDIRPDDTPLTWLQRTEPNYTWIYAPWADLAYTQFQPVGLGHYFWIVCTLHTSDLQFIRQQGFSLAGAVPTWPGLDGVTLGTPIAVTGTVHYDQPLDGALLDISSLARAMPQTTVDTWHQYRNTGRYAFISDNGYMEDWRGIPGDHCVLTPLTIEHPAGLLLFFFPSVEATLTPWTLA